MNSIGFRLFLVGLTVLGGFAAHGQAKWINSYGALGQDEALCSDAIGDNYYVGGYFSQGAQMGAANLQSNGFSDGFLTKLNGQGIIDWVCTIGGAGADRIFDVAAHANGKVAVTGYITGNAAVNGQSIATNAGSQDAFVMLCNAQGIPEWTLAIGGQDADTGYGVSIDANGNVYCTGQFKGVAQIGPFLLTSALNPQTNTPSHDIFVVKIAPNGEVLWAKQGAASGDDRGLSLCNDALGNVYLAGQSSDTLQFGNSNYPNTVFNAGFLMKIDTDGNEAWLTRLATTQTLINELEFGSDNHLYLTGDHIGQMAVLSENSTQLFPGSGEYNIFLAKFDINGEAVWLSNAGSANEVSSKSLCEGDNGEWYVAGTFKCRFSDFSAPYGEGVFYSLGYRDIFVARYNADGSRVWERNYGSPKDDFCAAVAFGGADDPLFFGSYGNIMQFPDGVGFGFGDGASVPGWSYTVDYCDDANYGQVQAIESVGALDVFMARAVLTDVQPFDWFLRNGQSGCTRNFIEGCLGSSACPDTLAGCGVTEVPLVLFTHLMNAGGPDVEVTWTGDVNLPNPNEPYLVTSNIDQWVLVTIERLDGCYSANDSIYTLIHPFPTQPLLTDDVVINTECASCEDLILCEVQPITLTASGITESDFGWVNPELPLQTELTTSLGGTYVFEQTNAFGCSSQTSIHIQFALVPDTVAPYIVSFFGGMPLGVDSVGLCPNDGVLFQLLDSLDVNPGVTFHYGDVLWTHYHEGNLVNQSVLPSSDSFAVQSGLDGWHTVHASYTEMFCDEPVQTYPLQTDSVFITSYPEPELVINLTGPSELCPGDSLVLTASGAASYVWSGPSFEILTPNTIAVFAPGVYSINHSAVNEFGCSVFDISTHEVTTKAAFAGMLPENGIVCPFDSVMLFTEEPYMSYQWIGPMGELLGTEQTQWATVPGLYHCQVADAASCALETNFIEVKAYSSPFLEAFPGTDLCVNGEVQLTLATNDEAEVMWIDPLSGNGLQQFIDQPGTYTVQSTLCDIATSLDITIVMTEVEAEISVISELPACLGDTVFLIANPGMNLYNWNPGGYAGQQIAVTESGTYNLTTVDAQGCLGFAEPVEIAFTVATATVNSAPAAACPGDVLVLEALGTGAFAWYQWGDEEPTATGGSFEFTMDDDVVMIGVSSTVDACESEPAFIVVEVHPSAEAIEMDDVESFCAGDEVVLTSPSGELNWSGPAGTFTGNPWNLGAADPEWTGVYTATYADNLCQSPPVAIELWVAPSPPAPPAIDTLACLGSEITLFSDYAGLTMWYNPSTQTTLTTPAWSFTMLDSDLATTYHFVSEAGCVGESAPIFVESIVCTGEQANIFTPNNDGTNDTYEFKSWSHSIEVVRIYNRWGQLVRELIDEPFVWNGKSSNGDQVEDGVYFIVLSSRVPMDGEYTRTGVVYVKR